MILRELISKLVVDFNSAPVLQANRLLDLTKSKMLQGALATRAFSAELGGRLSLSLIRTGLAGKKFSSGLAWATLRAGRAIRSFSERFSYFQEKIRAAMVKTALAARAWAASLKTSERHARHSMGGMYGGGTFGLLRWVRNNRYAVLFLAALFTVPAAALIKAGADYEQAFLGILKVTKGLGNSMEGLTKQGKAMEQQFFKLSKTVALPLTQLLSFGAIGGQMGVANKNLVHFAEIIGRLSVSIQGITPENTALDLARLDNVVNQGRGDYDRAGASLVALGNEYGALEGPILSTAIRMMGFATIAKLSVAQLLGFATGARAAGTSSQAVSTALQKVTIAMRAAVNTGRGLSVFSKTLGISGRAFKTLFAENAGQAMIGFLGGLHRIEQGGGDSVKVLAKLGLADQRLITQTLILASGIKLLKGAVEVSNQAWVLNTALLIESNKRFGSLANLAQLAKNALNLIAVTISKKVDPHLKAMMRSLAAFALQIDKIFEKAPDLSTGVELAVNLLISKLPAFTKRVGRAFAKIAPVMSRIAVAMINPLVNTLLVGLLDAAPRIVLAFGWSLIKALVLWAIKPANWLPVVGGIAAGLFAAITLGAGPLLVGLGALLSIGLIRLFQGGVLFPILGFFARLPGQILSLLVGSGGVIFALLSSFSGLPNQISSILSVVGQSIFNLLTSPFQAVIDWLQANFNLGKIVSGLIESGKKLIGDAMSFITKPIRDHLPFSPAKEGPLSDLNRFGPGFIGTLTHGIRSGKGAMGKAMDDLLGGAGRQPALSIPAGLPSRTHPIAGGQASAATPAPISRPRPLTIGSLVDKIIIQVQGGAEGVTQEQAGSIADRVLAALKERESDFINLISPIIDGEIVQITNLNREHLPLDRPGFGSPSPVTG